MPFFGEQLESVMVLDNSPGYKMWSRIKEKLVIYDLIISGW